MQSAPEATYNCVLGRVTTSLRAPAFPTIKWVHILTTKGLLWELSERTFVKYTAHCFTHRRHSINGIHSLCNKARSQNSCSICAKFVWFSHHKLNVYITLGTIVILPTHCNTCSCSQESMDKKWWQYQHKSITATQKSPQRTSCADNEHELLI